MSIAARHRRSPVLILVACLALATGASSARGETTVEIQAAGGYEARTLSVSGDDLADRIAISGNPRTERVMIASGSRIAAPVRCDRVSRKAVRCPFQDAYLDVYGGGGADRIELLSGLARKPGISVYGDFGNDVLIGGDVGEYIVGGDGNDRVFGRAGYDRLYGDYGSYPRINQRGADRIQGGRGDDVIGDIVDVGRDVSLGGLGDDKIYAYDESRDRVIDGGKGRDGCERDPFDPPARDCESADPRRKADRSV